MGLQGLGKSLWRNKKEGTWWACTRLDPVSSRMSQHPRGQSVSCGPALDARDQLVAVALLGLGMAAALSLRVHTGVALERTLATWGSGH